MIVKWPGVEPQEISGLHYNVDLLPTLAQLLSVKPGEKWDGVSYAPSLLEGKDCGRDYLVLSQMAHVCQRSVRMGDWLYMRTYHGGLHLFADEMLFNLKDDPHEKYDVIEDHPEIAGMCARILLHWHEEMMEGVADGVDPMETVLREGGPLHSRGTSVTTPSVCGRPVAPRARRRCSRAIRPRKTCNGGIWNHAAPQPSH